MAVNRTGKKITTTRRAGRRRDRRAEAVLGTLLALGVAECSTWMPTLSLSIRVCVGGRTVLELGTSEARTSERRQEASER